VDRGFAAEGREIVRGIGAGEFSPVQQARFTVEQLLGLGADRVAKRVAERLDARGLDRVWLHVDLDVLDREVMPAVDSPGSPGLDFTGLSERPPRSVVRARMAVAVWLVKRVAWSLRPFPQQ
jgi:hypothetical protein